jgi:phosphatidylethanolamine/phosphatidyl-N-methylethanolamine N-methyltransferase
VRVLEVGGGTGSITEVIAACLHPADTLDVFEIDPDFCALLRHRFTGNLAKNPGRSAIRIHNQPIEAIDREARYDFIFSCLPFTNFQPDDVREIFELYRRILNPGGVCSFFEYIFIRAAARVVRGAEERRRAAGVERVVAEYLNRWCFRSDLVLFNIPPAKVLHISFPTV